MDVTTNRHGGNKCFHDGLGIEEECVMVQKKK